MSEAAGSPEPGSVDALQFDKAEYEDPRPKCVACGAVIENEYYHLNGQVICPNCAVAFQAGQQRPQNRFVLRGALYGLGAAIACSIGYAIITMTTGYEFAIAAIAVGYLVGRAIRKGSNGLGGRRCQVLAVLLTYFAVTTAYVPLVVKSVRDQAKQEQTQQGAKTPPPTSTAEDQPMSPMAMVIGFAFLELLAIALPFLNLTSGFGGIIGLAIIFFGLQQAWRQTARDERLLMGPYTSTTAEPQSA